MKKKYDYNLGLVLEGEDVKRFDGYMNSDWDTEKGREISRRAHQRAKEMISKGN